MLKDSHSQTHKGLSHNRFASTKLHLTSPSLLQSSFTENTVDIYSIQQRHEKQCTTETIYNAWYYFMPTWYYCTFAERCTSAVLTDIKEKHLHLKF